VPIEQQHDAPADDDPEALYERAPCGYLTTAPDGTIIRANQTFLSLLGYERAELEGVRRFAELLTGGGRIYHETHYAPLLQMQGVARAIALDVVRADGTRVPVLVNSVLERDAAGAPTMIRTAVFDATERRSYERQLLDAKQRAERSEAEATALARTLQQILIPPAPPVIPDLDIAGVYRPAGTGDVVGGDFFDVFESAPGDWIVVVGDVCGKGPDAAVVTSHARHAVREAAVRHRRPSAILEHLNTALLRYGADRFCTAAIMRWHQEDGTWSAVVSSGGHPLPLLHRPPDDPVTFGLPGSLIGVFDNVSFHDEELVLRAGDVVVLTTDGVAEGRGARGFYGDDRLADAVVRYATSATSAASATMVADGVLDDVLAFQDGDPRDDIVVVVLRVP